MSTSASRTEISAFRYGWLLLFAIVVAGATSGCVNETKETQTTSTPTKNFTIVELKPDAGELEALLKEEIQKAKESGRKPFVEFYADWCRPRRALRGSLDDPLMIKAFDGTHVVQLNVDAWGEKAIKAAGFSVDGVPVFFEIDDEGKPTGRSITSSVWDEDIPVNMAPPLKEFFQG
ncbi:hypothetical protein GC197_12525 [bacterium]|nr:hypothetical protein [bacterium]